MNYRWVFRETPNESTVHQISQSLNIPRSLAQVLVARGVTSDSDARKFFRPDLEDLHSPFLMDGMTAAVERIEYACKHGELIWIHGDYDVDGTTSTAMTLEFLREIGCQVQYYIPTRLTEGYGLSRTSIEKAKEAGASLVISVDCGITSIEPITLAKQLGLDVLVVDHHEPGEQLPPADVILDPLKPGCNYPFKQLAACGVAFKLAQAIFEARGEPERAFPYLDYVAVASAADIMPIVGENRILSHFGLELLNTFPRPGFKGLLDCSNFEHGSITNSSIIYGLAPRINAAGRLGDARRAVDMMISRDGIAAFRVAQELEQENRRRRALDEYTFEDATRKAEKYLAGGKRRSLVLHYGKWHAGVIGIVASRLVEKFHLPTVLLTNFDSLAKGSARSIKNFDIYGALKHCEHFLHEFGGHKHAAGLSLKEENLPPFRDAFDERAQIGVSEEMLQPEIVIDTELQFNELSPSFFEAMQKFAPFGYNNYKPVFYTKGVISANGMRIVGQNHLKFRAFQSNFAIDAIGFSLGEKIKICSSGKPFSIVYTLEENTYNGNTSPQLRIKDLRPEDHDTAG